MKEMSCQQLEGGTIAVCAWINRNDLAENVVSIIEHEPNLYSVFYIGKFEHYNPTTTTD